MSRLLVLLALIASGCTSAPEPDRVERPEALVARMERSLATTIIEDGLNGAPGTEAEAASGLTSLSETLDAAVDTRRIPASLRRDIRHIRWAAAFENRGSDYDARLQRATSLTISADEIHERALRELDGFTPSDVEDTGTMDLQSLLDEASSFIFDIEPAVVSRLGRSANADLDLTLDERPGAAASAPAHYRVVDGVGIVTLFPPLIPRFGLRATTLRYTLPGAHLLPQTTTGSAIAVPAHLEGWALFSLTLLETPPERTAFHIAFEAARAAIDTGIHARGWPRIRAIEFAKRRLGVDDALAAALVDDAIGNPATGAAPFAGFDFLRRLEADTKELQGERYDLRAFVDAVTGEGVRPLPLVREQVGETFGKAGSG